MLSSCILPELEHKFCQIRNHCFSHYLSNTVQGRVQIKNREQVFLGEIQAELVALNDIFKPVYCCHALRVEEFLIKKGKCETEKMWENIRAKMDLNLTSIEDKRKKLWKCKKKKQFCFLLSYLLRSVFDKLKIENVSFGNFAEELEAFLFSLNFVISHCDEDYSKILVEIADELNNFILVNKGNEITISTMHDLKRILLSGQTVFEEIFDNVEDRE